MGHGIFFLLLFFWFLIFQVLIFDANNLTIQCRNSIWVFMQICSMVDNMDLDGKMDSAGRVIIVPERDEVDEKSFEEVQKIIGGSSVNFFFLMFL